MEVPSPPGDGRNDRGTTAPATALIDADGRVQLWSDGARALTGYPAHEIVGRDASLLGDRTGLRGPAFVRALLRAGDGLRSDWLRHRDGTCRSVRWFPVAVHSAAGPGVLAVAATPGRADGAAGGTAVAGDPADPDGVGDAGTVHRMLRSAPIGLAVLDTDLRFRFVNEALARLNGRPVEGHLGRSVLEVLDLPDPQAYERVLRRVVDEGETVEGLRAAAIRPDGEPYAVVGTLFPLRDADGAVTGVGGYVQPLGEADGELLDTVRGQRRLELLDRIGTRLGRALDPRTIAAELRAACVPGFADDLAVDLLDGAATAVPGAGDPRAARDRDAGPLRCHPLLPPKGPGRPRPEDELAPARPVPAAVGACVRSARTELFETGAAAARGGEGAGYGAGPGAAAGYGAAVPLATIGRVLGAVTFRRSAPFDAEDLLLAREIAARAATAIGNALLYRRERLAALALQRHLLPAGLPSAGWFRAAYRYRPAEDGTLVGGDWYDAVLLPGGRVGFGVGDVMGHGLGAAAAVGRYRSSVHALLSLGLPPGQLLTRLDGMFGHDEELPATCVCLVHDAGTGRCRLALAGHPPPLLVTPDGDVRVLHAEPGPPLGMGLQQVYPDTEHRVPAGSLLICYTDGMVEGRGTDEDLDHRIAVLGRAVHDPGAPLDELCEALMTARPADSGDDATLLVARLGRV
ncbi:SpoIIE family protein phosphatase [Kitasatospora sp. NBC_00240]|uniref:SpoIIE family protein phosphatase n=1 Tax=Kitasatospora sp. NBC_00240 TaxID=2903567 RepID=UPI00224FC496|nr:SpoIIE family protein phosphatase [Kitasatospora sp. NBC_00240]MCX5208080.1 SpoIIE family protein phosphatase [Kitasatospora sp. NBC_00240]